MNIILCGILGLLTGRLGKIVLSNLQLADELVQIVSGSLELTDLPIVALNSEEQTDADTLLLGLSLLGIEQILLSLSLDFLGSGGSDLSSNTSLNMLLLMFLGELHEVIVLVFHIGEVVVGRGSLQVILRKEILIDSLGSELNGFGGLDAQEKGNDCNGGSFEHFIKRVIIN